MRVGGIRREIPLERYAPTLSAVRQALVGPQRPMKIRAKLCGQIRNNMFSLFCLFHADLARLPWFVESNEMMRWLRTGSVTCASWSR